jgi:hypothetical protein
MNLNCKPAAGLISCLSLALLVPLSAQVTGSLSGIIEDPSGKAVVGARVVVILPDSNAEEAATITTTNGTFLFPVLRPIFYTLTVSAPEFKTQSVTGVKIDPTRETSLLPIRLELGDVKTTVEAAAPTQTLQTSTAEVASTLTQEQVSALPLSYRDPLASLGLLDTLPGVANNGRSPTTIDGQSVSFANITYDGINIQDNFIRNASLNSNNVLLGLRTDQISEATIVTSNPGTIYTGGSAQVAFSTPSGTNNFHGSLYWLNVPRGISGQLFLNSAANTPATLQINQAGATVGGPIIKNKLFYFANFESDLDRSTAVLVGTVPTTHLISSNQTVQQFLNQIPLPNGFVGIGPVAGQGFNYAGLLNNGGTRYLGLARLDYIASQKHVFSFSTSMNESLFDALGDSAIFSRQPNSNIQTVTTFFSGSWRWTPTPHITNEVRMGASVQRVDFQDSTRSKYPFILAFTDLSVQPMFGKDPQGRSDRVYNYQDNLTLVRGRHTLQAGFSLQQYREWQYGIGTGSDLSSVSVPTYILNSAGTVFSESQPFNLTSPTSGYVPFSVPVTKPESNLVSGYLQDNWKALPHLSLNLGVRYDYLAPVHDDSSLAILPFLSGGDASMAVYNQNLQFSFVPKGQGLYNRDKNNFAPYFGFAWQVGDRVPFVVRAAYSISYVNDDVLRNMSSFAIQNPFQLFFATNQKIPAAGIPLPNVPAIPTPTLPALSLPALAQFDGGSASKIIAVDPNLRTPYVQQLNFGVETQWQKFLFTVRYVGNRLAKGLMSIDRNQVTLSPKYLQFFAQNGAALTALAGLFPQEVGELAKQLQICGPACNYSPGIFNFYGNPLAPNGIFLLSNLGRSRYDSLQVAVTRRVSPGLSLSANYSFSKTLSNIDDYNQGNGDPNLDIHNAKLDFAPSPFNLKHAFKMTAIYDLPFARGTSSAGLASRIFGGWSLSGVLIAQSGAPFSLLSTLGTFNTEQDSAQNTLSTVINSGQIEQYFGVKKSPGGTVSFVNAPAGVFFEPNPGQVGTLQRRMFTGPNAFNLDLGIRKVITVTERARMELRAESLNLLNNENWLVNDQILALNLNGTPAVNSSGKVAFNGGLSQWTPPRSFQFLLRVRF